MTSQLFKFTEYGTLNQICIAAKNQSEAENAAKREGDYRMLQYMGPVLIVGKK